MNCPYCNSKNLVKAGKAYTGGGVRKQRFLCMNKSCRRTTTSPKK